MRRYLPVLIVGLAFVGSTRAQGLLIPADKQLAPLAMVNHEVNVAIEDQVAVTKVVQSFRNATDRALEATYVFPVPQGASVTKFTMWVDGKEVAGELVEANKARSIYTDIVRRTQDPGLLEYMGNNLLKLRIFPVPAHGDQKVSLQFTSVAPSDAGLIEYVYPLRGEGKSTQTVEKFVLEASLKSQHAIQNIYSPSHAIAVTRPNDRQAVVRFERKQVGTDKDFQLYYTTGAKDVGLTALFHRPAQKTDGHFMLLISPRAELSQTQAVPRDIVFVLDTSGSMQGKRIQQAQAALKYCLRNLNRHDRFGLIHFATTVTKYSDSLVTAGNNHLEQAQKWVDRLEAVGSTNIDEALATALAMRPGDAGRSFTVVFFTDGQPTIGEQNPDQIVKNALAKNTANTRIFTFGVGDDVNAVLLDQLADKTRSVSTYVRENEDIEAKVSGLYSKISKPVLTDLKLKVDRNVTLSEIYPPQLPDLFHGSQLIVLGRFHGNGPSKVTLTGKVGKETRALVYEVPFPAKTKKDKGFVEDLWARRKVGYLLDQIRATGQNKELVDEVVQLAKKHGITTPYTSYLVVPDASTPVANGAQGYDQNLNLPDWYKTPHGYNLGGGGPAGVRQGIQFAPVFVSPTMQWAAPNTCISGGCTSAPPCGPPCLNYSAPAPTSSIALPSAGKQGVDLSVQLHELRNQSQLSQKAVRQVAGRNCREINGIWIDEKFDAKMPVLKIKAQSDAYFRILERQPQMREVFQLGNRLVWITPSGTALVIDANDGQESLSAAEVDRLFVAKK